MAERSNAAVLKTVDGQLSGGSNPSLSAIPKRRGTVVPRRLGIYGRRERDSRGDKPNARPSTRAFGAGRQAPTCRLDQPSGLSIVRAAQGADPSRIDGVPMSMRHAVQTSTLVPRHRRAPKGCLFSVAERAGRTPAGFAPREASICTTKSGTSRLRLQSDPSCNLNQTP